MMVAFIDFLKGILFLEEPSSFVGIVYNSFVGDT